MYKLFIIVFLIPFSVYSQGSSSKDTIPSLYRAKVELSTIGTSKQGVPFWLRSNQFGSIPEKGASISVVSSVYKDFKVENKVTDWAFGITARGNVAGKSSFDFIEAYVKGKFSIFQLSAGRSLEMDGLVDSTLSSGSFSLSGNALGIPKIELSIPNYLNIPFTNSLFAFKGNISHGWMGHQPIQYSGFDGDRANTYAHHASFYGRFGKPDWRLKIYSAINHDVMWGSDNQIFGGQVDISDFNAFLYVVSGAAYSGARDISKIGNHQGSLDLAADYNFDAVKLRVYHQFFYDKGALAYLANIKDGLTGISLERRVRSNSNISWKKALVELFYSKDQGGEAGAKKTPSGPEYYYNHAIYANGYSYNGLGLGNPLITPKIFARPGQASSPINYFINNRVVALHIGLMGFAYDWDFTVKATASRNYGDYRTSGPSTQWFLTGKIEQLFTSGKFKPVNQFSGYLEASKPLVKTGYRLGFVIAGDYGSLLNDNVAGLVKISKSW